MSYSIDTANKVPMMFRAQGNGRCQLRFLCRLGFTAFYPTCKSLGLTH
jgi:hypothetical protein